MRNIKLFEDFDDEENDKNDITNHSEVLKTVAEKLGRPFSTNADWGGANVWLLQGPDNFKGTFIYQGDDEVVVLNRVFDEENEENVDTVLKTFSSVDELEEFVDAYLRAKKEKSIDAFLEKAVNERRINMFENFKKPARRSAFAIDDEEGFPGWTFDEEWNGWDCPYFEKDAADKIAAKYKGSFSDDAYTFQMEDMEDEPERYESLMIDTEDGKKKVWAIGAYAWVWSEKTD